MKNSIIILLFAFFLFNLTGCNKYDPVDSEEYQKVVIFVSTQSLSSLLKSTTVANNDEKFVGELLLFGVDNEKVEQRELITIGAGDIDDNGIISVELILKRKIKTLYAVANPTTDLKNADLLLQPVTALTNMTVSFGVMPGRPFLMSGTGTVNSYSATIELFRAVAKVEIESLDNDLKIISVTAKNTPNQGYVFERKSLTSIPGVPINYNNPVSSPNPIYVAENIASNPTNFELVGEYKKQPVNYTIVLKKNDDNIPIQRNKHYKVGIKPLTESQGIISLSIPDWEDGGTQDSIFDPDDF